MKKHIIYISTFSLAIFVIALFFNTLPAFAVSIEQYFPPALGPTLGYKCGVNGFTNPLGRKNGIALNKVPDVGLTFYAPLDFTYNLGLYADFMYNTHSFLMKYNFSESENDYLTKDRMRFSYFTVSPTFNHLGFKVGFSVGIPISADWEGINITTSKLNTLWEVKAGYTYPLYFDEVGRLNVFINISYALNGVYSNFSKDDPLADVVPAVAPQIITNYYNPRPASVQIGLNFLFNLIQLPEEYYEW